MTTDAVKQDSNVTGLRFTREVTPGALSGSDVWKSIEPNSYKDFGGQFKKVARQPINASRQRRKGVTVDLDASGGYQSDLTYTNVQDFAEGVFFADFRKKTQLTATSVDGTLGLVFASGASAVKVGALIFNSGFAVSANNGVHKVATVPNDTHITFSGQAADAGGSVVVIGYEFASGDLVASASGYTSTTKDLTELGLIPGEWIFVGGDVTANAFATAGANGYKRIVSVAANAIVVDKSDPDHATDAGTGKTIRVYVGRVLKNELGTSIKQYTYQFERTLGAPDSASPSQVQSEYLTNALFDQMGLTFNTADKITFDVSIMASDYETRTGVTGVKAGTRPSLVSGDAFNTTDHVRRAKMSIVGSASPLFAYLSDISFSIKNNVKPNKAISVMGAFSHSAGDLEVASACTAYFADVTAVDAVRNNSNVTVDLIMARSNQGMIIDLPLVSLGDGRLKVAINEPITLPLSIDAATAVDLNTATDYTVLMTFFDYLPTLAM
jgi:hypothetical protein